MMKKLFIFLVSAMSLTSFAQDTAFVFKPAIPVRVDRDVNITYDIKLDNVKPGDVLNQITVEFSGKDFKRDIEEVSVYYSGSASMLMSRSKSLPLMYETSLYGGGQKAYSSASNAIKLGSSTKLEKKTVINLDKKLAKGVNYLYISVKLNKSFPLDKTFDFSVSQVEINKKPVAISQSGYNQPFRSAISVRNHGDNGVNSYRIPGLETSADGALLAVYDVRRNSNYDLQEDIQVGLSASYDKGKTWQPMQMVIDMRGANGLPDSQNGVGDPAIAANRKTGEVWCMGLWTHGIGGSRAWTGVQQGISPEDGAAQVVIAKSTDNGKTWGKPLNITPQIKDSSWYILLQGPGKGIIKEDGTIVFPFQFVDSARMPHATIVWSKDNGKTWTVGQPARSNTTEAQVVELANGDLMLNMRDNRKGSRAVLTTSDLGKTWTEHSSHRSALIEPVCMASLIKVKGEDNVTGKDLLIFSNPNTVKGRSHMTIKVSLDEGKTWLEDNQLLIDSEPNWGYSCLTMVDNKTVGILYESSVSQMLFQTVKLEDLIKK